MSTRDDEYAGSSRGEDERYAFKRRELERLKNLEKNVNGEDGFDRVEFVRKLYFVVRGWMVQLPDLSSIFQREQMDRLLTHAAITCRTEPTGVEFIRFVVCTGYKDRFDVPEDGKDKPLLLRRTTPLHAVSFSRGCSWEANIYYFELFKIYDRFDVNYVDESGLTHFHLACLSRQCSDVVRKFLELGQDPNLVWEKTGDSPLHLSAGDGSAETHEMLLRNGANPNLANKDGLTSLHISVRQYCYDKIKTLFEICEDTKQPLQVNARDNLDNTPLHLAMESLHTKDPTELLLRNGADPNAVNDDGSTPLHAICKYLRSDVVEPFFRVVDELNQWVSVDARDKLGRTPLQLAVASLCPDLVDVLLDRGADLTSFVLPLESDFRAKHDRDYNYGIYTRFRVATKALTIFETLEEREYEVDDFALIIMKIFSWIGLLEKSRHVPTHWYEDKEFVSEAKKIKILPRINRFDYNGIVEMNRAEIETATTPSLSLYDLVRLRPEEAAKILPYRDYYNFNRLKAFSRLRDEYKEMVMLHLFEKVSRGFCRRWALESFFVLIHYQLPVLCCEMVIDQLTNGDLCNICFAATGQDP